MALNATFTADFTKWDAALKNAQANLKTFEVAAKNVGPALQKAVNQFDGVRLRKDAELATAAIRALGGESGVLAGVTRLTAAEQKKLNAQLTEAIEKYKRLGQEAPKDMQALAEATKQVEQPTEKAGLSVKKLVASYVTGQAIWEAAKATFSSLVQFVGSSIESFASAERATKRLTVALKNQGDAAPETIEAMGALAEEFQNTTRFSDDLVTEMQALFVQVGNVGPKQMGLALTAATNLADGLGIDLEQAATAVAKALAGNETALRKMAPALDEATLKGGDLAAIAAEINQHFGGQSAAALETYAGRVEQLANQWDNIKESIGGAIVQSETFKLVLRSLSDATKKANEEQQGLTSSQHLYVAASVLNQQNTVSTIRIMESFAKILNTAAENQNTLNRAVENFQKGGLAGGGLAQFLKGSALPALPFQAALDALDDLNERMAITGREIANLDSTAKRNIKTWLEAGFTHAEVAKQVGVSEDAVKRYDDALKKNEQTQKKNAEAAKKLAADVKAQSLAMAKWVREIAAESDKTYEQQADKSMRALGDRFIAEQKLREEAAREIRKLTMSATDFQIDEIRRWYEKERYFIGITGELWKGQLADLEQTAADKLGAVVMQTDEWRLAMAQLGLLFPPLLAYLDELDEKMGAAGKAGESFGKKFRESLEQSIGNLSEILIQGLLEGRDAEEIAVAMGSEIGSALGSSIGLAIGGPLGEALGEAIGSLLGPLIDKLFKTRSEKTVERSAYEFGRTISEELADGIEDTAKERFGGNRQASKIFHLRDVIQEIGLDSSTYGPLMARFRDLFSMIETGAFSAAEGVQVLEENFATFAEFVTRDGSLATRELLDIINLTEQFGLKSAEVARFVVGQTTSALGGLTTFLDNASVKTQAAADGIGAALFGIFEAQTANGVPAAEIIRQLDPLIDKLDAQLTKAGLSGGAAFQAIKDLAAVASHEIAGPLITGVLGLEQALAGLHNSGVLTEEMFDGLTASVADTYQEILATGVDGAKALQLISPTLQTIWELQKDFGYTVDEATQALLDEAKAAGVVGEAHRSAQEQMLRLMERQTKAIEHLAKAWGYVTDEINDAADAIENMPTPDFPDARVYTPEDYAGTGGGVYYPMAEGGLGRVTRPTLFLAGERGPEDFAFSGANRSFSGGSTVAIDYDAMAAAFLVALQRSGLTSLATGVGLADAVDRFMPGYLPSMLTRNPGDVKTKTQSALGVR